MSALDNISKSQFHMVTNMKAKPNSQGTLFGVNPSARTPESRQPRGYSPERFREVTAATGINYGTSSGGHGKSLRVYSGHAGTLAKAAESLARSTVPMSDITRPHKDQPASDENPDLDIGIWPEESMKGNLGHYSRSGTTAMKGQGRIALASGTEKTVDQTVLHEIGHHVDRGSPYNTAESTGRAEGFADQYAETHGRTPGRKKKAVSVAHEPERWHHNRYASSSPYLFDKGYSSSRNLQPKQFNINEPPPGHEKTFPKGHIQGQQALLHKIYGEPARYGRPATPTTWRYADDLSGERR